MSILMFQHGVCYGQFVTITEVQQWNTTQVQIRECLRHCPHACWSLLVWQWNPPQRPHAGLHSGSPRRPRTLRCREATLLSTGVNSNIVMITRKVASICTPASYLTPWATLFFYCAIWHYSDNTGQTNKVWTTNNNNNICGFVCVCVCVCVRACACDLRVWKPNNKYYNCQKGNNKNK